MLGRGVHPDFAAVGIYDSFRYEEAESCAFGGRPRRSPESVENVRLLLRRDPRPLIRNADAGPRSFPTHIKRDLAADWRKFNSVSKQVGENLQNAITISVHKQLSVLKRTSQCDLLRRA